MNNKSLANILEKLKTETWAKSAAQIALTQAIVNLLFIQTDQLRLHRVVCQLVFQMFQSINVINWQHNIFGQREGRDPIVDHFLYQLG
jgi:hypothetical protein